MISGSWDEFELIVDVEGISVDEIIDRWHHWRNCLDRAPSELKRIGLELAEELIPYETQRQLLLKVSSCRARNVSLLLKIVGTVDFLSRVPWEVLEIASPDSIPSSLRLAQQSDIALIRVAIDSRPNALREMGSPIRFLVASANIVSSRYPDVTWISAEMSGLKNIDARGDDSVEFLFLEEATQASLEAAILEFRPDIFHFSGNAGLLESESCLVLHPSEAGFPVNRLGDCLIQAECKVAIILANESDCTSPSAVSVLVRAGIPTVIGLQDKVRDASIAVFSRVLYDAILDGIGLDQAVSEARLAIAGPQYSELLPTFWSRQSSVLGSQDSDSGAERVTNLPRLEEECIGRNRELQELERLVLAKPLLGITGLGGIGKSLLTLHLAHRIQPQIPKGVWLFDGTEIRDEATLWDEFVEASYPWNPHLADSKSEFPESVIVVDDVDQWESGELKALIKRFSKTPTLHLVLTGRSMSELPRDDRFELGPLDRGSLSAASESLFLELTGLEADELGIEEKNAVLSIANVLEGVPLAIKVAASRAAIIGPTQMAELLKSSPLMALGGRKSSFFEAIERSISTLEEEDQLLLYRTSIFSGSFDWESLKAIYPDDPFELLNGIERLCEAGLVWKVRDHQSTRIVLSSTVRDFARETLPERLYFVLHVARKRHLDRFLDLAKVISKAFQTGRWSEGSRILRLETQNFKDALDFATDKRYVEKTAELCSNLCRPLLESGRNNEFSYFLEAGYKAATELGRLSLQADLLGLGGAFAGRIGERYRCVARWKRRAEICLEIGDIAGVVDANIDLALESEDYEEAIALVEHAERLLNGLKRSDLEATAGMTRAKIELMRGNISTAVLVAQKYGAMKLEGSNQDSLPYVQTQLGNILIQVGRYGDATKAYVNAIRAAIDGERRSQAAVAALGLSSSLEKLSMPGKALQCAEIARDLLVNLGSRRVPEAEARIVQLAPRDYLERAVVNDPLENLRDFIETLPNVPLAHHAVVEVEEAREPHRL